MVMAARSNKVFIPFEPLLHKITSCLQFPPPVYGFMDSTRNNVWVQVVRPKTRRRLLFFGGDASTVQESRERAAHKAVKKLIFLYGVKVDDFTNDQVRLHELCMKLFRNKCAELLQANKRNYKPPTGNSSVSSLTAEGVHVSIDYAQVLVIVVRKTGASVTVIETTWVEGHGYISWVMITCPRSGNGMECIFSDPCNTASVAEQRVAKKAVFYLACKFNLEIVDANYGATAKMSRDCFLLREKYLLLKGHLEQLGNTSQEPVAMNSEVCEENVVATGEGLQVLDSCSMAAVPAKRKKLLQLAYEKDLDVGSSDQAASGLLELRRMFDSSDPK